LAKEPKDKTYDELAQDMYKRPDSLDHLTAKAEMARRSASVSLRNSRLMLASVLIALVAAIASAASAYFAYLSSQRPPVVIEGSPNAAPKSDARPPAQQK